MPRVIGGGSVTLRNWVRAAHDGGGAGNATVTITGADGVEVGVVMLPVDVVQTWRQIDITVELPDEGEIAPAFTPLTMIVNADALLTAWSAYWLGVEYS